MIEVDGEVHQQQVDADRERDQMLSEAGFRVLRFTNQQVVEETEAVLVRIVDLLPALAP